MILNPYLNFDGNAEEAFRFYHAIFGGEFFIQKMDQAPATENLPENEKKTSNARCNFHRKKPTSDGIRLFTKCRTRVETRQP